MLMPLLLSNPIDVLGKEDVSVLEPVYECKNKSAFNCVCYDSLLQPCSLGRIFTCGHGFKSFK